MINRNRRRAGLTVLLAAGAAAPSIVFAQSAPRGGLYDPEPPADSAYLRVVVVGGKAPVDVLVDGKPRGLRLADGVVSDYLILPHGRRTIGVAAVGAGGAPSTFTLDVPKGKALTLAFDGLKADAVPTVFEDRSNTNKLKAQLAAYHLDRKAGAVDVVTADGATRVFTNLAYGASNSIQVNPISVELTATRSGAESAPLLQGPASLSMTQGGSYSVFLLPDGKGGLIARTVQNKTERYAGARG